MLPEGEYRYELTLMQETVAREYASVRSGRLHSARERIGTREYFEVEAHFDESGYVIEAQASSLSGLFTRTARYKVVENMVQGVVRGLSAVTPVEVELGRYRGIDFDLAVFKALMIAHILRSGADKWTGRVAFVEPTTLMLRSVKHSYSRVQRSERYWLFEPMMGEVELIEVDTVGRLLRRTNEHGAKLELIDFS